MEEKFCQSCGMPLIEATDFGTNKDGGIHEEYCIYCFKDGDFTSDVTMEEMIQISVQHLEEFNKDSEVQYTIEEAIAHMRKFFPELKRWKA